MVIEIEEYTEDYKQEIEEQDINGHRERNWGK